VRARAPVACLAITAPAFGFDGRDPVDGALVGWQPFVHAAGQQQGFAAQQRWMRAPSGSKAGMVTVPGRSSCLGSFFGGYWLAKPIQESGHAYDGIGHLVWPVEEEQSEPESCAHHEHEEASEVESPLRCNTRFTPVPRIGLAQVHGDLLARGQPRRSALTWVTQQSEI
jgi:hypothetical protein